MRPTKGIKFLKTVKNEIDGEETIEEVIEDRPNWKTREQWQALPFFSFITNILFLLRIIFVFLTLSISFLLPFSSGITGT